MAFYFVIYFIYVVGYKSVWTTEKSHYYYDADNKLKMSVYPDYQYIQI